MWRYWSVGIVALWVAFLGFLALTRRHDPPPPVDTTAPAPAALNEEIWTGIYQNGAKVGFGHSLVAKTTDGFEFKEETTLRMVVLDRPQVVVVRVNGETNSRFELQRLEFDLGGSAVELHAKATVHGREIEVEMITGSNRSEMRITAPVPPSFPGVLRSSLRGELLRVGNEVSMPVFDPVTMGTKTMRFEVLARESVPHLATPRVAWRVRGTMGEIASTVWLDDDGSTLREEGPMGLVMLREDPNAAVNAGWTGGSAVDVARAAAVPVRGEVAEPRSRPSLRLRVHGNTLALPSGSGQRVDGDEVLIKRADVDGTWTFELPSRDPERRADLAANAFVQADDEKILSVSRRVVGDDRDAQRAARRLVAWVYDSLAKVPTVSVPNALSVLEHGEGDCNEHAVLLMALTRAAGIPTRLAAGLVFVDGAFLYHAWNEVWLGRWVAVDSALGQFPADATHVKLAGGDVEAMFAVVQGIGTLSIDVVDDTPAS